ncbi:Uncharacterised protein [Neisseria meningitidis]|nr:Uncharacterised protein [Neisseria meningitidis]CWN05672.1 Uncharacterised protein [Neisseria meningitidis]CWN19565.1 Uncharacterised protein [Neisseria meningitidis]CWN27069.1 Uncharacterised protein [Neisseria meningitidis]CWN91144.1 Uncharacterised protein [Neisseria meningitidis]
MQTVFFCLHKQIAAGDDLAIGIKYFFTING